MQPTPTHFEGANLGDVDRTDTHRPLQCGGCGWVFDPEHGDPLWGVPAGTPFAALPDHWHCPQCDAPRDGFIVIAS
jgi:rubredoxin